MNKKLIAGAAIILLSLTSLGLAQAPSGSVRGKVVDAKKQPIAGASVLIMGPSILGYKSFVCGKTGAFQFPLLLPGECEIRAEFPGYQSKILKGIKVEIGKTVDIPIMLEASETEVDVPVDFRTPAVDVRNPAWIVTVDASFLEHFPRNRDIYDILNTLPTALSEDLPYDRTASILGGTGRGQRFALDGSSLNDIFTGNLASNVNTDGAEQIEFDLAGRTAEAAQGDGTYVSVMTKTAGNSSHVSLLYTASGVGLTNDLYTTSELNALRVNAPQQDLRYRDFSLHLGGPLWEDRAWYFLAFRRLGRDQVNPASPEARMKALGFEDSTHYDLTHRETMFSGRVTVQATNQIRYSGDFHLAHAYEPVYSGSFGDGVAFSATTILDHDNTISTAHQVVFDINPDTTAEARAAYSGRGVSILAQKDGDFTYYDDKQKITWGMAPYNDVQSRSKLSGSLSLTHVFQRLLGAQHEVRIGGEFEQSDSSQDWYRSNPFYIYWKDYAAGNPYYMGDGMGLLRIIPAPYGSGLWNVKDGMRRFSAYLQDTAIAGRFAFSLGLRFDYAFASQPVQSRPALSWDARPFLLNPEITDSDLLLSTLSDQFHAAGATSPFDALSQGDKTNAEFLTLSPRFGLAMDVFGDGRTAFKLSAGRSFEALWIGKYRLSQIFAPSTVDYLWLDLNGNMVMDLMPDDAYKLLSMPSQDANHQVYSDFKVPYTDEISAGLEHEIAAGFKVGFRYVWKKTRNIIEDVDSANGYDVTARDDKGLIWLPLSVTDPGWDGALRTADDRALTVYGLRADRPTPVLRASNPEGAERNYRAAALTFEKRMSDNWQLQGSIAWTSYTGNVQADSISSTGRTAAFDTPNSALSTSAPLAIDRPFQVRVFGTWALPAGFFASAYFQHYSGAPIVRTLERVYFPSGTMGTGTYSPYYPVVLETSDEHRGPAWTNVDLRLEKLFTLSSSGRLSLMLDVLNALGDRGQNIDRNPGGTLRADLSPATYTVSTTYGKTLSVYGVRTLRLGLKLSF
jgi:hypothetical protein